VQGRRNPIEGVLRGIEERLAAPWREVRQAREVEAEAHRDSLWAEAAERERLLVETVEAEESRRRSEGEICRFWSSRWQRRASWPSSKRRVHVRSGRPGLSPLATGNRRPRASLRRRTSCGRSAGLRALHPVPPQAPPQDNARGSAYCAVQPPSTSNAVPVTKLEAREARNTAGPTISHTSPNRPCGTLRATSSYHVSSSMICRTSGVVK
jgi:hypothetical protein